MGSTVGRDPFSHCRSEQLLMNKRIVISGWYGHGNVGDEAILQSVIERYRNEWPDCDITVLSSCPRHTENTHKVNSVPQYLHMGPKHALRQLLTPGFYKTMAAIWCCDLFVMGGGGFLSDWQPEAPRAWLTQMRIAKLFGKRTVLYAIGAGPFTTKKGRKFTRSYIDGYVDEVSVRDKYAYRALVEDVGVQKDKVEIVDDPVFSLDLSNDNRIIRQKKIGISLVSLFEFRSFHDDDRLARYLAELHSLLRFVLEELPEYEPILVPFMATDVEFFEKYFRDKFPSITIANVKHYKDVANVMYGCRLFIATRFHSLVLAILTKTPVFSIVYHSKSLACCETHGIPYDIVSDGSLPPLPGKDLDSDAIKEWILSIVQGEGSVM